MLLLPESLWFIAASVADILLTSVLLMATVDEHAPFRVREGNPVAGYILDHWGLERLVYFKLGMTAVVIAIAEVVATKRQDLGRRILRFGTIVVGAVVAYSLVLLLLSQRVS